MKITIRLPSKIPLFEFHDGSGLLTGRRVRRIERLENFVQGMEEHATKSLARASDTAKILIHIHIKLS
jgi:hypothetical protein